MYHFQQVTEEDIILKLSKILQIKYYRLIIKKPSFYYESTNGPKYVHIVDWALQNVALCAWWDHLDVVGEKQRCHIDDTWEVVDKQQEKKWPDHWPVR